MYIVRKVVRNLAGFWAEGTKRQTTSWDVFPPSRSMRWLTSSLVLPPRQWVPLCLQNGADPPHGRRGLLRHAAGAVVIAVSSGAAAADLRRHRRRRLPLRVRLGVSQVDLLLIFVLLLR